MTGLWHDEDGQMVVELAVIAPVVIVVCIVVMNLMQFMGQVALFDRVAPDAVISQAVSPSGEDAQAGGRRELVRQTILDAMDAGPRVDVSVTTLSSLEAGSTDDDALLGFSFAPNLTRYVCVLSFTPWPSSLSIAGVDAAIPFRLTHRRTFTVDCYSPGVFF